MILFRKITRIIFKANGWPAAVLLAACSWLVSASAVRDKSNTFDELFHLTAGYSYWTTGKYTLHTCNGNLPQRFAALPLLGRDYRFVPLEDPDFLNGTIQEIGRKFFFELGNPIDTMLLRSRSLMGITGISLVLLAFCWSRSLWGVRGGLVTAVLTAFCPTLLANAPLITSDAMAALFFLMTTAFIWRMLHRLTFGTIAAASISAGCLALSKMSAPLILPVAAVLYCLRILRGTPLACMLFHKRLLRTRIQQSAALACAIFVVGLVSIVLIWAAFGFSLKATQSPAMWKALAERQELPVQAAVWANKHQLLPEPYLYGFAFVIALAQKRAAFFNGEFGNTGWPLFFPYTFLHKTPVSALVLLSLALIAAAVRFWRNPKARFGARYAYRCAPLLVFSIVYGAAALASHLNIGHRHLLPLYPAFYVLAGSVLRTTGRRPLAASGIKIILILLMAESLLAWPNYIAFFNAFGGGSVHAYKHLVDSSLDWGQELGNLQSWLADNRLDQADAPPVYLSYFGTASIKHLGIRAELLPGFFDQSDQHSLQPLHPGVYCISATMLQCLYLSQARGPVWQDDYEKKYRFLASYLQQVGVDSDDAHQIQPAMHNAIFNYRQFQFAKLCAFLRKREPDYQIGYSILIYCLQQKDIEQALTVFQ